MRRRRRERVQQCEVRRRGEGAAVCELERRERVQQCVNWKGGRRCNSVKWGGGKRGCSV